MLPRQVMGAREFSVAKSTDGILVVDDEPGVLNFLQRGLSLNGFKIWTAASGKEAIEVYQTCKDSISAVLMDVRMPGLDGPMTLAALQSINPEVRCCFMSGGIGQYSCDNLLAGGAVGVIAKPFTLSEVVEVLRQIVNEYQPQEA